MELSFIYLIGAFSLGILHGLEPGHGKTVVAAYLIGSRGKIIDAIILGMIVTFTHTISVIILGLVCGLLGTNNISSSLEYSLRLICGGLVITIGIWMMISRNKYNSRHLHSSEYTHEGQKLDKRKGTYQVISLGISGGILPCPAAITILLIAIGSGHLTQGLVLVLLFSSGLAIILISIGIIVCKAKSFVERYTNSNITTTTIPFFSSLLIIILGIFIII